jgi:predicted nucleic acid-binding protein
VDPAVVDASVAIKWVYSEELSPNAIRIRSRYRLIAPELLLAECANILWKKVHREELADNEAIVSAAAIGRAGIEMVPMAPLIVGATRLALELGHPAYDCFYIELCRLRSVPLITADDRLVRKYRQSGRSDLPEMIALQVI